jgi:hypothetical protein
MSKNWTGSARVRFRSFLFDKRVEDKGKMDCRIKYLDLTLAEVKDLLGAGFTVVVMEKPKQAPPRKPTRRRKGKKE